MTDGRLLFQMHLMIEDQTKQKGFWFWVLLLWWGFLLGHSCHNECCILVSHTGLWLTLVLFKILILQRQKLTFLWRWNGFLICCLLQRPVQVANDDNIQYNHIQLLSSIALIVKPQQFHLVMIQLDPITLCLLIQIIQQWRFYLGCFRM